MTTGSGDGCRNGTYKYVLSLDMGSTHVRAHVYDSLGRLKSSCLKKTVSLSPSPGSYEIDPESLYESILSCLRSAIKDSGVSANDISCLGITTQRNTFITWNKDTGRPYHNFISWLDRRSRDYVNKWNNSYTMKLIHCGSKFMRAFTKNPKYKALSLFSFDTKHVSVRLAWALQHIPSLKQHAQEGRVMFGCMETWLVWRLTGGQVFATDYSCASTTGLYDTFTLKWSTDLFKLLGIPLQVMMPEVRDTSGDFGVWEDKSLGTAIDIKAVVGDQQSAMFGQCCFEEGDMKCTMGTGTFIDVNTGRNFHVSRRGLVSVIGWKIGNELMYLTEGLISDTGITIDWAQSIGFLDKVSNCSEIAQSVPDSGGVSFVSSFGGLQVPITDSSATTSIIGATPHTTKAHVIRSILESCAFRYKLLYDTISHEIKIPLASIRIDGGVSQNDFLVQLMTDFCGQSMERSHDHDMTCLGAAFLAGLASGVWVDKDVLHGLRNVSAVFNPDIQRWSSYTGCLKRWMMAVKRAQNWYSDV